ncbi:MAG TPA: tetratricopeptide repeat protein [Candidatus Aminicenantes bacterium]|nr:tetratricopeptide repeat protein [Candidatus Aminicenantes bacterium]
MKTRRLTAFFLALIAALAFSGGMSAAAPPDQAPPQEIRTFEELEAAIAKAEAAGVRLPRDKEAALSLARLYLKSGAVGKAEETLRAVLRAEPANETALTLLGRLFRNTFRFDEASALMAGMRKLGVASDALSALEADLAMDRMDFDKAAKIFSGLVSRSPGNPAGYAGLAEVAYWESRFDEAMKHADRCLAVDPAFSRAHFIKSLIHRIRQENDLWAAAGRKAVEADPFDADARANLSNILMRGEKKMEEGYAEATLALRIDPWNYLAHNYIGNGWTPRDYKELEIEGRAKTLLDEADALLLARDFGPALAKFDQALPLLEGPAAIPALLGQGTVAYHRQDYDGAIARFREILRLDPDYGLAHYGFAQSLLRKKDRVNVRFAEIEKAFAAKDAPEPPFLRDVFINYQDLDPDLRKIIRMSVKPLRALLKTDKDKGGTFYLTPFHKKQSEAPGMAGLKGQRTFDLRLWDDVKGLGGRRALSGEDWERDVKFLRFNVVAHEFAHQIHRMLPDGIQAEIDRLYAKAKAERLTLDFYSDTNVMEYFAVGVEAYVSEDKLADQKIAYGHTRRELLERDPDLYKLIERLDSMDGI